VDSPKLETKRNWLWRRRAASHALPGDRERGLPPPGSGSARAVRSPAAVSRSGVWLIGGTLLLAAAVLVWAFAAEIPGVATSSKASSAARPRPARTPGSQATNSEESAEAPQTVGVQPPAVPTYSALLSRDVFRPLVVPKKPAATKHESITSLVSPPVDNEGPDTWHGWRFNGLAQLSDTTYALVEQPDNRRSYFLKEGDSLEDAKVIGVGPDELVLQEPAGGIARVRRVDAMAELLRATQRTSPHASTATAGGGGGTILPGAGIVPVLPAGTPGAVPGGAPTALPAPAAVPDGFGRRQQRRGLR
jgi:hypothetical protein